jgi:hypothetical protein
MPPRQAKTPLGQAPQATATAPAQIPPVSSTPAAAQNALAAGTPDPSKPAAHSK